MANNITILRQALDENAKRIADEKNLEAPQLTDEDKAELEKIQAESVVVMRETDSNGTVVGEQPLSEYAKPLDTQVADLSKSNDKSEMLKLVNSGDIQRTVDGMKLDVRDRTLQAFKSFAVPEGADDEDIMRYNTLALEKLQEYFGLERFNTEFIAKKLEKMYLKDIIAILPKEFVDLYVRPSELTGNSFGTKNKLLRIIRYLGTSGPEMDYLNDYIDNENRTMQITQELIKSQIDLGDMLTDKKSVSELIKRSSELEPPDTSFWSKIIKDPKRVHNEFAQRAAMYEKYRDGYQKVLDEHRDDTESAKKTIQNQIDECNAKIKVYTSVMHLDTARELWEILTRNQLKDKRASYANIVHTAKEALDRIRRAKQNVPFPIYDAKFVKKPELLFNMYVKQFTLLLMKYNHALLKAAKGYLDKDPNNVEDLKNTYVDPIMIEGVPEDVTCHYMALYLLILYGRIMKKLSGRNSTKYNAIELDSYFNAYCKVASDIYLMTDFWLMMKDHIAYAIKNWSIPKGTKWKV